MTTKLLFIGCNYDQLPYLKNLRNRGYYIIGTDLNLDAPGKDLVHEFVQVSYTEIDSLSSKIKLIGMTNNDKVFTASSQSAHLAASIVANNYGIEYPSFENIKKCIDKKETYKLFTKHGINIPRTKYVFNDIDFKHLINKLDDENIYYVKSDFSKNPRHIYFGRKKELKNKKINWDKDQFFQEAYVVQEFFKGHSIRINLYENKFEIYDFEDNQKLSDKLLSLNA